MDTFSVLLKSAPYLGLFGSGLYLLLIAIFPSWRGRGWRHYKIYDTPNPNQKRSWLVDAGLVKADKPAKEGELSVSSAVWFYSILGLALIAGGLAGLVRIVSNSR